MITSPAMALLGAAIALFIIFYNQLKDQYNNPRR